MKLVKIGLYAGLASIFLAFMPVNASILVENIFLVMENPQVEAPSDAVMISEGLAYQVIRPSAAIPPSTLPGQLEMVIRYRVDVWSVGDDGTLALIANAEKDGLSTDTLEATRRAQPFFAEILGNTPVMARYRWWVSAEIIPEGTPGFEMRDHVIDIEIMDVVDPLPAPENVAAIPAGTELTPGGVGFETLRPAPMKNVIRPTLLDNITVHYAGWTTDGKMFDATYLREQTATFPLGKLIQGWQEAIPLMNVGAKIRIWIPGALGYDNRADRPFAPKGMLVFDVELVAIEAAE